MEIIDVNNINKDLKLAVPKVNVMVLLGISVVVSILGLANIEQELANYLGYRLMQLTLLVSFAINYIILLAVMSLSIKSVYPSILSINNGKTVVRLLFLKITFDSVRIKVNTTNNKFSPKGIFSQFCLEDPVEVYVEGENKTLVLLMERSEYNSKIREDVKKVDDTTNMT